MIQTKKILITGGAGFIGSHLTRKLLSLGYEVTVMDNLFTGNKSNIYDLFDNPKFTFILHDITHPFWGQFDEIYNLACPASPIHYQKNPVETMKASIIGITNVLDLALKTKAKVLHTSTSEIYGDPLQHPQKETYWGNVNTIGCRSCYDEGKRAAETICSDYAREYDVDARLVRIFNTYGPNMHPADGRVVSNFIMQALYDEDITICGDGKQTRSFQYVDNLIDAMILLMESDRKVLINKLKEYNWESIPVFNIGNPEEFTILELAKKVLELIPNAKSKIVFEPLPKDDPRQRKPDISMVKSILGWEPDIPLSKGLIKTIAYFEKNFGLKTDT
jgi:UDP-glucuronate decarboxylase